MTSLDLRQKFFDFFNKHNHIKVASSSLIPADDPTLLFANAGMNQFKDVFLGLERRSYTRAVSIQKCIRAGGKHNDLENVGFTKRHLTFFEMMGNFSFGDYFKKDAIKFAWDFLTQEIKLPADKLYASVYYKDNEAFDIWHKEIGLPQNRVIRLGEADNFWQMGDTGPCGPCSEIYIDRGAAYGCPNGACAPGCHCDRFLEIWNLVFMQFDRQSNGEDKPLKQTGVDTGMGLERLTSVVQNVDSVFDTDLFAPILKKIEELTGLKYTEADAAIRAAFRVLADHIRSSSFAIADGAMPSNEGRGYVIRKIIRRAALFAQKLNKDQNIFPQLAPILIEFMGSIYPELIENAQKIENTLSSEVEKFSTSLEQGQQILEKYFAESASSKIITGVQAFKLYDTYGFPLELTKVIAHDKNFKVDELGFEAEMEKQRAQSGKKNIAGEIELGEDVRTKFTGYDEHVTNSKIIALLVNGKVVQSVSSGSVCSIITSASPFYVECGGQISDEGLIKFKSAQAKLLGLKKIGTAIAAEIQAPVDIHIADDVTLVVDSPFRINTMKNHTATHLLQAALVAILGKQVKQAGSVVAPDYLRFDFTYDCTVSAGQISQIETLVNKKILENIPVRISQTTLKDATSRGVTAFFGEKYNPENVRVVEIPGFSAELCGGTHVTATGDIGCFKITEISTLAAGVKRLVAFTGPAAINLFQETFATVKTLAQEFKVQHDQVLLAIAKQKENLQQTTAQLREYKKLYWRSEQAEWLNKIEIIGELPFLFLSLRDTGTQDLRDIAQDLLKAQDAFYFLVSQNADRAQFFAIISPKFAQAINLKEFSVWLKTQGLQGGGSGNNISGGGNKIEGDLEGKIKAWIKENGGYGSA